MNKSLLKISIISLLLLSNVASFGMLSLYNPQHQGLQGFKPLGEQRKMATLANKPILLLKLKLFKNEFKSGCSLQEIGQLCKTYDAHFVGNHGDDRAPMFSPFPYNDVFKEVVRHCDLTSIGRLNRLCRASNKYHIVEMIPQCDLKAVFTNPQIYNIRLAQACYYAETNQGDKFDSLFDSFFISVVRSQSLAFCKNPKALLQFLERKQIRFGCHSIMYCLEEYPDKKDLLLSLVAGLNSKKLVKDASFFRIMTKELFLDRLNKKQLLLKNLPENKQFDFLSLPGELQYDVIQFFTSDDLGAFAQTSKENYVTIEKYKEMQKPLLKKYLSVMHDGTLARKIRLDNPNLPNSYCFPALPNGKAGKTRLCFLLGDYCFNKFEPDINSIIREQKILIKQYAIPKDRFIFDLSSPSPIRMSCLLGDYDMAVKLLEKDVKKYEFRPAFMIAVNEGNARLSELLLDAINHIFFKEELVEFYSDALQTLKLINNKDAFKLVVNKIPLRSISFDLSNSTLDNSDIALIQLREKELKQKSIEHKQEDQHCIIL